MLKNLQAKKVLIVKCNFISRYIFKLHNVMLHGIADDQVTNGQFKSYLLQLKEKRGEGSLILIIEKGSF